MPVLLINQHRIDTVADAEAYVSRLKEVERVMNDVAANVRTQAGMGILPPRFNFEPVRADATKVLTGAPFDSGPDNTILADFKAQGDKLDALAQMTATLNAKKIPAHGDPFTHGSQD